MNNDHMILDLTQEDDDDDEKEDSSIEGENLECSKKIAKATTSNNEYNDETIPTKPLEKKAEKRLATSSDILGSDDDDLLFGSPIFKRSSASQLKKSSTMTTTSSMSTITTTTTTTTTAAAAAKTSKSKRSNPQSRQTTTKKISKKKKPHDDDDEDEDDGTNDKPPPSSQTSSTSSTNNDEAKTLRAAERDLQRALKKKQRDDEKKLSQKRRDEEKQKDGKYFKEEIATLLSPDLFASDVGQIFATQAKEMGFDHVVEDKTTATMMMAVEGGGGGGGGMMRWMRRDKLGGGGGTAALAAVTRGDAATVEWYNFVGIVFHDPGKFLDMCDRTARDVDDDDYPEIRRWHAAVRRSLQREFLSSKKVVGAASEERPRLVVILHDIQRELDRRWNKGGRRRRSFSPTSVADLNDALVWLLMELGCECFVTSGMDETVGYLTSLTKTLGEMPYFESATELHCVKKIRCDPNPDNDAEVKAKSAWFRMLRQVPGMSAAKADSVARRYPTMRLLMDAYEREDLTLEEKRSLVASMDGKNYVKVSDALYRFMTSENPMELI